MNWWSYEGPYVGTPLLKGADFYPQDFILIKIAPPVTTLTLMYSWAIPPDKELENVTDITDIPVYKMQVEGKLGESRKLLGVCLNHKTPQFVSEWYSPGFSVPHNVMLFWKPDVGIGGCKPTQQLWLYMIQVTTCHLISSIKPLAIPWQPPGFASTPKLLVNPFIQAASIHGL